MSLAIKAVITCDWHHVYLDAVCENKAQTETTATWDPKYKEWDVELPVGWRDRDGKYLCPACCKEHLS